MKAHEKIGKKVWSAVKIAAVVLIPGAAVYIMANGLGLVDGLDFGAGAYYYADIPNFASYVSGGHYDAQIPMWACIVLFLAWGALMYKLWCLMEKKGK